MGYCVLPSVIKNSVLKYVTLIFFSGTFVFVLKNIYLIL